MWLIESAIDGWIRWRTRRLPVTPLDRVADGARVTHVVFDADSWSAPEEPSLRMRDFLKRHRLPERRMLGEPILYRHVEGVLEPRWRLE